MNKFASLLILIIITNTLQAQQPFDSIKDIDGNYYGTIKIGSQIWMSEDLRVTKYNNGVEIPSIKSDTNWRILKTPGLCFYNHIQVSNSKYGVLYNWYVISANNLCPIGWKVPNDDDWTLLDTYLGGQYLSGGKLKERGTKHWAKPNKGADNSSGMSLLPSGYRIVEGAFYDIGYRGSWWSSTLFDADQAYARSLNYDNARMVRNYYLTQNGLTIRCIKKE